MASFVSSKDLSAKRELKRQARGKYLQEEEEKFTRKEKLKQKHKESGNDRWVLPNIDKRIIDDSLGVSEPKTEEKRKKHKKKNKKKSSSRSESEEEQWEEKPQTSDAGLNPSIRDDWLNFDSIVNDHTFTSTSLKEEKKREKDKKNKVIEPGHHPRELNPFWKDGGTGLPSDKVEEIEKPETKPRRINKDWLLRSLKRMNEQAEEQGRNIEDIAAERYESWEEFQKLLAEADPGRHQSRYRNRGGSGRRFMRPDSDDRDRRRYDSRSSSERHDRKDNRDTRHVDEHTHSGSRSYNHSSSDIPAWKKGKSPVLMTEGTLDELERKCREKIKEKIAQEQKAKDRSNQVKDAEAQTTSKLNPSEQKSESATPTSIAPASVRILTEKEKNQLGAKILKAELVGNEKLANTLKMKLERAWEAEKAAASHDKERVVQAQANADHSDDDETVVLTRTGKDGQTWPLQHSDMAYDSLPSKRRKKSKKIPTHAVGERERYFADDDRYSLKDLVMRERTQEAESNTAMLSRLASKQFMGTDSEYFTLDDKYVSEAARQSTRTEEEAIQKQKAMADHKKLARRMEKCHLCFGNTELSKHLLIAIGKKAYLALPESKPLTEGHCFIAPLHHCGTGTGLDEDVWDEIRSFMLALKNMFKSRDMDCVFMQTCMSLSMSRHFLVDCIPLPKELGDVAPIYYKKAIQESENEWTNNKKLIDTRNKDLRRCIPKGLPYFAVEFGTDGGFAHVIEDEALFPVYFGKEIVGGMLDVTPNLWRRPPRDHFGEQTKRSLQFSEWWKNYDWTVGVTGHS